MIPVATNALAALAAGPSLLALARSDEAAIDEIVVSAGHAPDAGVAILDTDRIGAVRPLDLADTLRLAPAFAVATNSRGEAVFSARGSDEREASVFLDGAPLDDPWDRRVDLARLPALGLGAVEAAAFPDALRFSGAGPVLRLRTIDDASGVEASGEIGGAGLRRGGARVSGGETVRALAAAEFFSEDGAPLSDDADLPFSQSDPNIRTNTDRERSSALVRIAAGGDARSASLTALYTDEAYGVAPEGHIDPAAGDPRFWRVPEDRRLFLAASGAAGLAGGWRGEAALWGRRDDRTIEDYPSGAYAGPDALEASENTAYGLRAGARRDAERGALVLAVELSDATRRQREGPPGAAAPDETFRRLAGAVSTDVEIAAGPVRATVGARVDAIDTLASGGRDRAPDLSGWSARAGVSTGTDGPWRVSAAAGRTLRIPTQRELYGAALGRFLANPDLRPETSLFVEACLAREGERAAFRAGVFGRRTDDAIDQEIVDDAGVSRRRRINVDGIRLAGAEIAGTARLGGGLAIEGWASAIDLERDDGLPVAERPETQGFVAATYEAGRGFGVRLEAEHRGPAVSIAEDGSFAKLPSSVALDVEAPWRGAVGGSDLEVFARLDNALDAEIIPQLGLPASGRRFRIGASLAVS